MTRVPFPGIQVGRICRMGLGNDWSLCQWPWASYIIILSCSLNICVDPKNSTNLLVFIEGKKAFICDGAWQSNVLDNWVLIPWIVNQFGPHYFQLVFWEGYVLRPVILQLYRMLLEMCLVELPTNPHVVLVLYNDGNAVWRISVRPGWYPSSASLLALCPLGNWLMSQMNQLPLRKRKRIIPTIEGCCKGKHLAQFPALSRCLIKGILFPLRVWSGFGASQSSFRKKPDEYAVYNWGHILSLDTLLKQLQWVISHEDMNNGNLIKQMQKLPKTLWKQTLSRVNQFCHLG